MTIKILYTLSIYDGDKKLYEEQEELSIDSNAPANDEQLSIIADTHYMNTVQAHFEQQAIDCTAYSARAWHGYEAYIECELSTPYLEAGYEGCRDIIKKYPIDNYGVLWNSNQYGDPVQPIVARVKFNVSKGGL